MDRAGRINPLTFSLPRYNPNGFFFWGYVIDQIFSPKVDSLVELRARINSAVASVTPLMLENTRREIEYRLNILQATNGIHVEKY
jgi:hypothetical protein